MFYECNNLTTIDLSSFNTSAVTNMSYLFRGCNALTTLDLSSFNTSAVTNMLYMFRGCNALTTLDLSSFNTSLVEDMHGMFYNCTSLTNLDLSSFNTSLVEDMSYMFYQCSALTEIILYQNTSSIIKELPFGTWTVTDKESMYIHEVTVSQGSNPQWNPVEPDQWTDAPWTFYRLKVAKDAEFNTEIPELSVVTAWKKNEDDLWYYVLDGDENEYDICVYADTAAMTTRINGGTSLELDYEDMPYEALIDVTGKLWKVNKYTVKTGDNIFGLFGNRDGDSNWNDNVVEKLRSLTIRDWTNKNVTDMERMFSNCSKLISLNLSNFDTNAVKNMKNMFSGCNNLTTLTISQNADLIIKEIPSATWTVTNNALGKSGTVKVSQGASATWSGDVPSPWILTRTIQA